MNSIASTSNLSSSIPIIKPLNNAGPPPDLSSRYKLKSKYSKLQRKYQHALLVRKDLTIESEEKEEKLQRLQDEVNLVIDQIYDSDYAHLAPQDDNLFSESEDEQEEVEEVERLKDSNDQNSIDEGQKREISDVSEPVTGLVNGTSNGKTRKHESSPEASSSKRPRLEENEP